jgi:GT2 family glycosyltransferase
VSADAQVSVVVCTRNRCRQAYAKAQWVLAQKACAEAIFVVDGTEDDTVERLAELAATDSRLRLLPLPTRSGLPAARNVGIRAATAKWVLLMDDDDIASEGFLDAMLEVADEAGASIVGAPWFNLTSGQDRATFIAAAPRRKGGPALDRPGFFPDKDWDDCLWFTVNALFRRSVFDEVEFDHGYAGNYYREDTDFLVSAARAGHRVVATARAYTYLQERVGGGVDRKRKMAYEYWVLRNNWRFLRKHGEWLRESGYIRGSAREQLALAVRRSRPLLRAAMKRLVRRRPAGSQRTVDAPRADAG